MLIWICSMANIQTGLALSNGQMTCVKALRRVALAALMMNTSSTSINRSKKTKTPTQSSGGFWGCNSLTMSYFHTGTRTIIGAKSFHGPVRDGKEWYQLAMVIRHNLLSPWSNQGNEFIERYQILFLNASLGITSLITLDQSYRVKSHEQLVSVSLTYYYASTPDLSTSWSWTTL